MRFFLAPLFTLVLAALVVANPVSRFHMSPTLRSSHFHTRYPNRKLSGVQHSSNRLTTSELDAVVDGTLMFEHIRYHGPLFPHSELVLTVRSFPHSCVGGHITMLYYA
jgi:hypothetical protein